MKNIIFITIFILSNSFIINAQNYFLTLIGEIDKQEHAFNVIQNNTDEYIICGVKSNPITDLANSYIFKLSEEGKILQEKIESVTDSFIGARDILQLENNNYLLLYQQGPGSNYEENNFIILSEIDDNFNTITEKKIKFPIDSMEIYQINMKKANENEIICYGNCSKNDTWTTFLYKLTTSGDSILFEIMPDAGISDLEINNSEKIYYMGPRTANDISVLNYSDFSVDTIIDMFNTIGYASITTKTNIEFLSDSTFVVSGVYPYLEPLQSTLTVLGTSYNVLYSKIDVGYDKDGGLIPQLKSLDINTNNEIYTAIWYFGSSEFYIAKIDSELNIIWEKLYEIDYSPHWSITFATNDGGCMFIGLLNYDDIIIVKTDPDGNITHINGEPSDLKAKKVIVCPNPTTGIVNIKKIQQITEANIKIYDIKGKLIMQKQFSEKQTAIDLSNNPAGTYFYNIISENKLIDNGKIILTE